MRIFFNADNIGDLNYLVTNIDEAEANFGFSLLSRRDQGMEKIEEMKENLSDTPELPQVSAYSGDEASFDIAKLFTEEMFDK